MPCPSLCCSARTPAFVLCVHALRATCLSDPHQSSWFACSVTAMLPLFYLIVALKCKNDILAVCCVLLTVSYFCQCLSVQNCKFKMFIDVYKISFKSSWKVHTVKNFMEFNLPCQNKPFFFLRGSEGKRAPMCGFFLDAHN